VRAWRSTDAPLIVCYGNINRSAFAEGLARMRGRPNARSGGFYPIDGRSSPPATVRQARHYGVELSEHHSRSIGRADLAAASAIFAFDLDNLARIAVRDPGALTRTHLVGMLDLAGETLIADPHGRSEAVLGETLRRIAGAIESAEAAS
jgi:protein-tyrosine-phosphatase